MKCYDKNNKIIVDAKLIKYIKIMLYVFLSFQLSFSPTTPGWSHIRLVGLLTSILTLSGIMFVICICVGFFGGLNTFAFMAAEVIVYFTIISIPIKTH